MIKVYCDGSAVGTMNEWTRTFGQDPQSYKQPGAWAAIICIPDQNRKTLKGSARQTTNLIMEIRAITQALLWCDKNFPGETIFVHTDCQCVVRMAQGSHAVKSHVPKVLREEWNRFLETLKGKRVAFNLGRNAIGESGVHLKAKRASQKLAKQIIEERKAQLEREGLAGEAPAPETEPIPTL